MTTPDLRALLGDRYVETMRAAVLADNPDAITSASRVGGKLGQLMYLSAVDRLNRTLAAVLPDLLAAAWDEGASAALHGPTTVLQNGVTLTTTATPNPYRTKETR